MAIIKYVQGDDPNISTLERTTLREGYGMRRGKITRRPRAAWDMKDGDGKGVDPDAARKVLDEAER
jgi:hypothetical protein